MCKKNNLLAKLLAVMLCLTMVVPSTVAAHISKPANSGPAPRYTGLFDAYVDLYISNSGLSTSTGEVSTYSGYTANVTMELQQKAGSQWNTLQSWTDKGKYVILEKNWYVVSSNEYRVELSIEVFNSSGKMVDDVSIHSDTVEY